MKVLSLFDGMSCGQIALQQAGVHYDRYFASEIEKHPVSVTMNNFPNTVQIGDVRNIHPFILPKIDLLIGGSPCQSFSFAGNKKGMSTACEIDILTLNQYLELKNEGFEFQGQSYLFWEYVRLLKVLKPKWFLLENVQMADRWKNLISYTLGVKPVFINSDSVSGQTRKRLYWTNIPFNAPKKPNDICIADVLDCQFDFDATEALDHNRTKQLIGGKFQHGLCPLRLADTDWNRRFFAKKFGTLAHKKAMSQLRSIFDKSNCLTTSGQNISNSGSTNIYFVNINGEIEIRPLEPVECERLQNVPDGYTKGVTRNQRIHMLGNGWTVGVIAEIFKGLQHDI